MYANDGFSLRRRRAFDDREVSRSGEFFAEYLERKFALRGMQRAFADALH